MATTEQAIKALPGQWGELRDGFYEMAMDTYLSWPLVSSSLLGAWKARTPKYVRWLLDGGKADEQSDVHVLGSVTHTAILEPDLLTTLYVSEPEPDPEKYRNADGSLSGNIRNTKAFKDDLAKLAETGKTIVTTAQWTEALAMRDAVHNHSKASALIKAHGKVEISGIVTDDETGVRCKIRPDKLVDAIGANVNVKTSQNAAADAWVHDLFKYGYFRDFAFYERCLRQLGFDHRKPIALVIDSKGPKDDRVAVYEIDEGAMDAGHQLVEKYLYEIAQRFDSGTWDGHPEEIVSISLPSYAWVRVDEELAA